MEVNHVKCNALVDTGATKSCISEQYYQQLMQPQLKDLHSTRVTSATGGNVNPLGMTTCTVQIGQKKFNVEFIVCRKINRPCYLGLDFLRKYRIGIGWSPSGKFELQFERQLLIESINIYTDGPKVYTKSNISIQPRALVVLNVRVEMTEAVQGLIYDVVPNPLLKDEYPNLATIPLLHNVEGPATCCIPFVVINLSQQEINLPKGQEMGHL